MSKKELLIKEIEHTPDELLDELLDFVRFLQAKTLKEKSQTALASENVLGREWLRPEEDEAWRDL